MPPVRDPARMLPGSNGRRLAVLPILLILLALGLSACVTDGPDRERLQSWGYVSWWLPAHARDLRRSRFDRLAFFEVRLATDGGIADRHGWPEQHHALRRAARWSRVPLDVTVTLKGRDDFEALFSSPAAIERLLATCLRLADDPLVQGLQIDVEHYDVSSPQALAGLRGFVPRLAHALHAGSPRRSLSVFVPTGGAGLYDAASLAEVDWAVMQAYDAHWISGPNAGPVAPLSGSEGITWEKVLAESRALGVPPERVIMTYPLYAYEWPVTARDPRGATAGPAAITTLVKVRDRPMPEMAGNVEERVGLHGCSHDIRSGSSNYLYKRADGNWVSGWYEGAWSLLRKRDFVLRHDIAGIAFFVTGYDDFRLTAGLERDRAHRPTLPGAVQACM